MRIQGHLRRVTLDKAASYCLISKELIEFPEDIYPVVTPLRSASGGNVATCGKITLEIGIARKTAPWKFIVHEEKGSPKMDILLGSKFFYAFNAEINYDQSLFCYDYADERIKLRRVEKRSHKLYTEMPPIQNEENVYLNALWELPLETAGEIYTAHRTVTNVEGKTFIPGEEALVRIAIDPLDIRETSLFHPKKINDGSTWLPCAQS